jgi:capsular exopolysaccharide synthesis family protein
VTSAQASEGKTTIAAALAQILASAGTSVLVIDGNLRHPVTHLAFGMNSSRIGLSGLLKSVGSIPDAVQRTNIPGIWLLSGGALVEAPALVLEQNLPALLTRLREKIEVIIIDGPATLSGSEASILASMADGVVLVVDARHDRLPLLLRTKEILNSVVHVPTGVVMNFFSRPSRNYYYATTSPGRTNAEKSVSVQAYANNENGKWKKVELLASSADARRTVEPAPVSSTSASDFLAVETATLPPNPASLLRPTAPPMFSILNPSQQVQ